MSTQGQQSIGRCFASLIRRGQMSHSFLINLDEPSLETANLSFTLFDRYGRLEAEYYEHDFRKGSGVWGKELDHGDILFIESIRVDRDWRRQGIATKMVTAALEKTRGKVPSERGFFAMVNPGVLHSEQNEAEEFGSFFQREMPIALSFWRSAGFRRIGASSYFAFTDKPDHPSRLLGPAQDWNKPSRSHEIHVSADIKALFDKLSDFTIEDVQCVNLLLMGLPNDPKDPKWLSVDERGDTFLHIAAMRFRLGPVRLLLSKAPQVGATRNHEGYTALEALRIQLERRRKRVAHGNTVYVMSDQFRGFHNPSIACLAALQNIEALDLFTLSAQAYGCTCGRCLGGFLSPRMRFALMCQAEMHFEEFKMFINEIDGSLWVDGYNYSTAFTKLPDHIRENLKTNKEMRQGFTNLCDHFAACLRRNRVPLVGEINQVLEQRQEWPPVTQTFLNRGGSVASVANVIFQAAMEQDEWAGDGTHREIFEENIDQLPVCRNDHEFGFVSGMCGYERIAPDSSRFISRL
ncbi:hypothetical protein CONLIGDRAFT_584115 [Coniochaeta ligniaria NRRL 30616]|uniref:N-acetyltransferase domain-containing protein n=1 Tax=Coniochaeta ligniaria NRRL 30616 TaxID=1408157 RepID=A0A1J7J433_9PEZI|nr:hypothetical protein CONLIGDRAFT_584115 [Coniochaeta ligniaria NRRL 30616]